jgi:hypothetical protein
MLQKVAPPSPKTAGKAARTAREVTREKNKIGKDKAKPCARRKEEEAVLMRAVLHKTRWMRHNWQTTATWKNLLLLHHPSSPETDTCFVQHGQISPIVQSIVVASCLGGITSAKQYRDKKNAGLKATFMYCNRCSKRKTRLQAT